MGCFGIEEIDSNLFKKDKAYVQLREYLTTLSFLDELIQKLFINIINSKFFVRMIMNLVRGGQFMNVLIKNSCTCI